MLQRVEQEAVIIVVETDVEEVNILTSDGTQQSTQTSSPIIDHEYQKPIEELNALLLNTPKNIVNAFGIIEWVIEKAWPQIPRRQANKK